MVMDTRILKVTDFIDLMLENLDSIESVSIVSPQISCIFGENYIPNSLLPIYTAKLWDRIFENTAKTHAHVFSIKTKQNQDKELAFKLAPMLVTYASRDSDVEALVDWMRGVKNKIKCGTPALGSKYKILFMTYVTGAIDSELREELKNTLFSSDKTDSKQDHMLMVEHATLSDSERDVKFEEFYDSHMNYTTSKLGACLRGFNSRWVSYEKKERFFAKYFERLEFVLTTFDKEFAKAFYYDMDMEFYDDYGQLLKQYEILCANSAKLDLFWQKRVFEDQNKIRNRYRVQQFALE